MGRTGLQKYTYFPYRFLIFWLIQGNRLVVLASIKCFVTCFVNGLSKFLHILSLLLLFPMALLAGDKGSSSVYFTPNKGQWDNRIRYQLHMNPGFMYLENQGVSYLFFDAPDHKNHEHHEDEDIRTYGLQMQFMGSSPNPAFEEGKSTPFYHNYISGTDASKWKSGIYSTYLLRMNQVYPSISMEYFGTPSGELKYEYHLDAGANPAQIRWTYKGAQSIKLNQGDLEVQTPLGTLIEKKPIAWQIINGKKVPVAIAFALHQQQISFTFPQGYDAQYPMVIDPVLVFSTFSGSTADNFGFTATYDDAKNTFGAGIVYPGGIYPTTAGAFQTGFNTPSNITTRDVGLSKFNAAGSTLIYSTYFGGSGTEAPHSIVCNANGELYIMGTTDSPDLPIAGVPFDNTFSGGASVGPAASGMIYTNGSDIFVARLNPSGMVLLSSTYLGGTANDGLNTSASLAYNYGDPFRGEVIIDDLGNVVIASVTSSSDYPVSGNAPEPVFGGGGSDAVVTRLNASLSTLLWSTYFGGTGVDAAYGVQEDSNGDVYVTGGTESANLIITPGVINGAYSGAVDGFLVRYSANGNSILASTYIGTAGYDQNYFVQVDYNDDVFVVGQTTGNYPIFPASVYNNGNSGQYIHKLNNTFTTTIFSTRVGRNTGLVDISPSAFLVNRCGNIYLSGWGGSLAGMNPYHATASSTIGMPLTPDAIQSTTDGNDFYLMILSENAQQLLFASYFGAPSPSNEHVDGGTSRFDKDGVVYQAVCGGCGGTSTFPTTPGVWSNTNNSTNCNLVVFKIDLVEINADALFNFTTSFCQVPASIQVDNNSTGAVSYFWDFGDGDTSSSFQPSHTYADTGSYQIMLVAIDSNTCQGADTTYLDVYIPGPFEVTIGPGDTICTGDSTVLGVGAGSQYQWTPAGSIIGAGSQFPIVFPSTSTTFSVIVTDSLGCTDTQSVYVHVLPFIEADFDLQFTPCVFPMTLSGTNQSTGGVSYLWDFGNGFTSVMPDAQSVFTDSGHYTITLIAIDSSTCNISDTISQEIYLPPPASVTASGGDTICSNETTQLFATGGETYTWFPSTHVDDVNASNPTVGPDETTTYGVIGIDTNGCADTAYITVSVFPPSSIDAGSNIILDIGDAPVLNPSLPGNGTFFWSPSTGLSCTTCLNPVATPEFNQWYYLTYTDLYNCTYVDSMQVLVTPSLFAPNAFTPNGDGLNEIFYVYNRNLASFELWIFDRWGEVIFHTTDPSQGWDGRHKNRMSPNDVYVWKVKYSDYIEPTVYNEKIGHVVLVR